MLTDGQTDGQTDGRTDRRTSSIHKPELLCNPAKNCKIKNLETVEASYGMMFLMAEINVELRKQICQKIGSERVKRAIFKACIVLQ